MQRLEQLQFWVVSNQSEDPANDRINHILIVMTIEMMTGLQQVWSWKKWISNTIICRHLVIVGPQARTSAGIFYLIWWVHRENQFLAQKRGKPTIFFLQQFFSYDLLVEFCVWKLSSHKTKKIPYWFPAGYLPWAKWAENWAFAIRGILHCWRLHISSVYPNYIPIRYRTQSPSYPQRSSFPAWTAAFHHTAARTAWSAGELPGHSVRWRSEYPGR